MTLYLSLDFDSKRLRPLGLWTGQLLLFACEHAAEEDGRTFFDYSAPRAPRVFTRSPETHPRGEEGLETVPELLHLDALHESTSDDFPCVIGAELSWQELDPSLRWCPRCRSTMAFIAQYVESVSDIPHDENRSGMLGAPYQNRWYACRRCRVIVWLGPAALNAYD